MCGFAGVFGGPPTSQESLEGIATRMALSIQHRGPDDAGAWADAQSVLALGHRRLSIIDLSPAGHQPMRSATGRFVIAFNGEIYNHLDLRRELEAAGTAPKWRGHSDTETLLAAFEHWGISNTLQKTVGMFALSLWDLRDKVLYLTRDRFGEKPLYYGWVASKFAFGSELKALRACPGFDNAICRSALAQYMRFMYVPAPRSIYEGIYKLEPGCLLSVHGVPPPTPPTRPLEAGDRHHTVSVDRWWSLDAIVDAGKQAQIQSEVEAVDLLEARLSDAVRLQSLADVPLGAFLSGGVDSSTIVSLMQKQSTRPIKTFTIGFTEADFDESQEAGAIAAHLGTDHTTVMVSAREAQALITSLPAMYDEPFADSSQIPTHLICRAARQHVTVALSGDSGDELFGGYNRYFWGPRIWARLAWMPYGVRKALGEAICSVSTGTWDTLGTVGSAVLPASAAMRRVGDKAHKLGSRLKYVNSVDDLYLSLVSEWQDPAAVVRGLAESTESGADSVLRLVRADCLQDEQSRMMYLDALTYLPDDILCKVDRAAMAVSLETRVPFLDHRIAELAWRLPLRMKIRGTEGKWALRQVLYRHVPRHLIDRPKTGFGIPVGEWLRGPLKPWADDLLQAERLEREGYLKAGPIREAWEQHMSGRYDWTHRLWSVLMFQTWLEANS